MFRKTHGAGIPAGPVRKTLRVTLAVASAAALLATAIVLPGRIRSRAGPAELWTDNPGILAAAELFNASQNRHLVVVRWKDNLAEALRTTDNPPAIAVGQGLRSRTLTSRFRDLDPFLDSKAIQSDTFYPSLLASGSFGQTQVLLPLSFELDLIAFSRNSTTTQRPLFMDSEDLSAAAKEWLAKPGTGSPPGEAPAQAPGKAAAKTAASDRMAFSYRWNTDFLTAWIDAAGANFGEALADARNKASEAAMVPLRWDSVGLAGAIERVRATAVELNGSAAAEDEFSFKYMVAPAYRHAAEGRILFAPMDTATFFLLDGNLRRKLDFRWSTEAGKLRIKDNACYVGLPKALSGRAAADAFLRWLFRKENQEALLEAADLNRSSESSFGIAGGFSSLIAITEGSFPRRHPELIGRIPTADTLLVAEPLPTRWPEISASIVSPWLAEMAAKAPGSGVDGATLTAKLNDYLSRNPEAAP